MSELVAETKVLLVHMKCEKCGEGFMEPFGNVALSVYPPQFPHKCNKCGHTENYSVRYPYQRMVPKEPFRNPMDEESGADGSGSFIEKMGKEQMCMTAEEIVNEAAKLFELDITYYYAPAFFVTKTIFAWTANKGGVKITCDENTIGVEFATLNEEHEKYEREQYLFYKPPK